MLGVSLAGVWAASRPAVIDRAWVPAAPAYTEHYFLVVSMAAGGSLTAFFRNPEYNIGVHVGTRSVIASGSQIILRAPNRPDIVGARNPDGTILLRKIVDDKTDIRFHPATPADLKWLYPLPTSSWSYRKPADVGDGWRVGTLATAGLREAPFAALMNQIASLRTPTLRSPYIQSVAIERHGMLVLDQYFYGFTAAQPHDVRSAGKSVTTLLVGRAVAETKAFSPASRVLALLPQYAPVMNDGPEKRRMTVADLMTMASGLACNDNDDSSPGNEDTMQNQPAGTDWYSYTLGLPMAAEPGTHAVYCSAGINLLGAIVQTETRLPLDAYFRDRFAVPMQFGTYAMWLMPQPPGAAYMGGGDYFRQRDFLKFGQLLLDRGRWYGRQIVDPDWIEQSTRPRTAPEGEGDQYGYGWHLLRFTVDGKGYDVINAGGNGGQLMIVVPALDVAVMVTAGNYGQYPVWRSFLPEFVTAVVRSSMGAL